MKYVDKQSLRMELQELTEQVLRLKQQMIGTNSGGYQDRFWDGGSDDIWGGDYDHDDIDAAQDARLTQLEDAILALKKQLASQQQQLANYFKKIKGGKTIPGIIDPGIVECPVPGSIRCRSWSAVEVSRTGKTSSSLVPFYVLGEVNNGARSLKLDRANYQGRDGTCLVLDLEEDNKSTGRFTTGRGYQTVRYEEKIPKNKYKKVQVNWQSKPLALVDVTDTDFSTDSHDLPAGPDLQCGSSGERVRKLQRILVNAGYKLKIDGDFGTETEEAVKDFQKSEDLKVDGIVGPITRTHLNKIDDDWWSNGKLFGGKMFWQ